MVVWSKLLSVLVLSKNRHENFLSLWDFLRHDLGLAEATRIVVQVSEVGL